MRRFSFLMFWLLLVVMLTACKQNDDVENAFGRDSDTTTTTTSTGSGLTIPILTSSPQSGDFGTVVVSTNNDLTFTISNQGTEDAEVGTVAITGTGFSIFSNTCNSDTLSAYSASTCTVVARVNLSSSGTETGVLRIPFDYADGASSSLYSLTLSATVAAAQPALTASPSTWAFGSVATNSSSTKAITIANNTTVSATVGTSTISGTGYSIVSSTCDSTVVGSAASCLVTVEFDPASTGAELGTLTVPFTNSDGDPFTTTVSLSGTGVTPSTSFSFDGFVGGSGSHSSSVTASGMVVSWTAQPAASYYKLFYTPSGGSTSSITIADSTDSSYSLTGLAPNTLYTLQINAYDGTDVSDGNSNSMNVTTVNSTGATFNGWTDIVAHGPASTTAPTQYTAITIADLALSATSVDAVVKLAWNTFTIAPSGSEDGYNIYRSTTSGAGFALAGTSATTNWTETATLTANTIYYYKIVPTISAVEVTPSVTTDTEVAVHVPPTNMALVHRWMVNREMCLNWLGASEGDLDRANNYRCAYDWGLGFGDGAQSYWDQGYSFVVDRWETGCKMDADNYGTAEASGGSDGDVYFKQGAGVGTNSANVECMVKNSGTWADLDSFTAPISAYAAAITNEPGFPKFNVSQTQSHLLCQERAPTGIGALRLLRLPEKVAATAWNGVFQSYTNGQIGSLEQGGSLPSTGGCNSAGSGHGISTSHPTITLIGNFYYLISGTKYTENCVSRYGVQDLIGNGSDFLEEQMSNCTTANACQFSTSSIDTSGSAGYNRLNGFIYDGVMGPSGTGVHIKATTLIPFLGVATQSASATLGSLTFGATVIRDDYNTSNLSYGAISADYREGVYTGGSTSNGRFSFGSYYMSPTTTSPNYTMPTFRCAGNVSP